MREVRTTIAFGLTLLLISMLLITFALMPSPGGVYGAPAPAITPVAIEDPMVGSDQQILIKYFDAEVITADTQVCHNLQSYRLADIEYVVDQGTTNTTTVTLEHTLGAAGTALTTNTTGQAIATANVADADDLNRFDLFGTWTCIDIDVTNTNAITWTVWVLAQR